MTLEFKERVANLSNRRIVQNSGLNIQKVKLIRIQRHLYERESVETCFHALVTIPAGEYRLRAAEDTGIKRALQGIYRH
jgi:hypothetical protein